MGLKITVLKGGLAEPNLQKSGKVEFREGKGLPGTKIEIKKDLTVGREGELRTHDAMRLISGSHCTIYSHFFQWNIADLGSDNGTYIKRGEDAPIKLQPNQEFKLNPSDIIIFGSPADKNRMELKVE